MAEEAGSPPPVTPPPELIMCAPRPTRSGFTLIEAIVLLAILAVMAGFLVPVIGRPAESGQRVRAERDMRRVADAFRAYHRDTGQWPSNGPLNPRGNLAQELTWFPCLYQDVHSHAGWSGPYLADGIEDEVFGRIVARPQCAAPRGLVDPWGRPYLVYYFGKRRTGDRGGIILVCEGPNGAMDTAPAGAWAEVPQGDDLVLLIARWS